MTKGDCQRSLIMSEIYYSTVHLTQVIKFQFLGEKVQMYS